MQTCDPFDFSRQIKPYTHTVVLALASFTGVSTYFGCQFGPWAVSHMLNALHYYWIASKGYRLRPWDSPYIRWRMETFFGPEADPLTARLFFRLLWRERRRLWEFLTWAREYRRMVL